MDSNRFVDFRAVKAAVTISMALDHYGVNWLRNKGGELRGRCPIHKGEGTDTFHANLDKNVFQCFSCKARGNVLDFVAAMEQCTVRDAGVKLADWFSVVVANKAPMNKATAPATKTVASAAEGGGVQEAENEPLTFELKNIDHTDPYLAERGIRKETAELFGVGLFPGKGSMSGRLVIPIYNERGELVAYAGRAVDGREPKYKLPAGFHKSHVLYNLHRCLARGDVKTVIVVEGFFDCMKVHKTGYPCVALMGSTLSREQEVLLRSNFGGAMILLDGDVRGTWRQEAARSTQRDAAKRTA